MSRHDTLHVFAGYANDAKTPRELCDAIEELGPLPRYHGQLRAIPRKTLASGAINPRYVEVMDLIENGKAEKTVSGQHYVVKDKEAAVEVAKTIYRHARQVAIWLRQDTPKLASLPLSEADPFLGLQTVQDWCIDAEKAKAPPPKPTEAEDKSGDTGRPAGTGDTDPKADRKTANAWKRWLKKQRNEGNYRASFKQFAKEKNLNAQAVKNAVERNRKRKPS